MSVSEAQAKINSKEFLQWMAYSRLEPFGQEVEDRRIARLAALIANTNRDPKRKPSAYTLEDFMPDYTEGYVYVEPLSAEDSLELMKQLAASLGGSVTKRSDN